MVVSSFSSQPSNNTKFHLATEAAFQCGIVGHTTKVSTPDWPVSRRFIFQHRLLASRLNRSLGIMGSNSMKRRFRVRANFFIRGAWLVFTVLLCIFVAFISQAASPDYRQLFLELIPFTLLQLASVFFYVRTVKSWSKWFVLGSCTLGSLLFVELGFRVFLNHA